MTDILLFISRHLFGIKDETCAELAMNWQFTLFKPLFVVAFRLVIVGDDGDGGVVRSDKDADNGTSISV